MRLESVEIGQYKNLKDFKINFNQDSFLDLIIGKNGSGKSNFFEVLIEIFSKLSKNELPAFKFKLKYTLHNEVIELISWDTASFTRNGAPLGKTSLQNFLPSNVIYYYAGLDNRLREHFSTLKVTYQKKGLKVDELGLRKFIDMDHFYYKLILFVMLVYNEGQFSAFLKNFLQIDKFEKIVFRLRKPDALKREKEFITAEGSFWGIKGVSKTIIDKIMPASKHSEENVGGLSGDKESFELLLRDDEGFKKIKKDIVSPRAFFNSLELVFQYGMIDDIKIGMKHPAGSFLSRGLSEGEKQIITIVGLLLLNENAETLMLLDEPDAFLHPKWQVDLCRKISEYSGEVLSNSHILLNSHSASTLVSSDDNHVNLFEFKDNAIGVSSISRKEAVSRLTEGIIALDEDESKLRIDNVIRTSDKPILFVEGPSDVMILEKAFKLLYDTEEMPFLIQDAFDRGFLKILFKQGNIFTKYPGKTFFGLFDFDSAYGDWRDIIGTDVEYDWYKGLCKKMNDRNGYVFLLPVPNNRIKDQAIDESHPINKIRENPSISIELLFWGCAGLDSYFEDSQVRGVSFKASKDKIKFATEVVPTLPVEAFVPFRPLFKQIRLYIDNHNPVAPEYNTE